MCLMLYQCYHCFKHCDYEKQQADKKNEDLEHRNRELGQKHHSMEHQKLVLYHTQEESQAEIDRLNDAHKKVDRETARHERKMEKTRLKHQRKPSSFTVNSIKEFENL